MAKLTWTITTSAGTVVHDSPTLSDANMQRFVDWIWQAYPQLDANGAPLSRNAAREAQAFRDWATAQYEGTKSNVLRHERAVAAVAAQNAVADITAT